MLQYPIPLGIDPLKRRVESARDLDYLWAEFMVTGNEKAVKKIIQVLDWTDGVRDTLSHYLRSTVPVQKKWKILEILESQGEIECDAEKYEIKTDKDLDIAIATKLNEKKFNAADFRKVKEALELTLDDLLRLSVKGAASWSLSSNAKQHEKVFEICQKEVLARSESMQTDLLEIIKKD